MLPNSFVTFLYFLLINSLFILSSFITHKYKQIQQEYSIGKHNNIFSVTLKYNYMHVFVL